MPTLVIQTVFPRVELLLIDTQHHLLHKKSWQSDKDEVRKVPPEAEILLMEAGYGWKDISAIISVVGIGNFSATRIGVTIANILAMAVEAVRGSPIEIFELVLERDEQKLLELIHEKYKKGWEPVKLALPVYASEPMISPSKKKKY